VIPEPLGETETFDGDGAADSLLGEAVSTGFRRVSAPPEPLALARMRALLLDAASDGTPLLREGLEGFQSWRCLETLCGSEWAAGTLRGSVAVRRVLRRRLRLLGARPRSVASAAQLPVGAPVHLRGTIRSLPSSRLKSHIGHIWFQRTMTAHNVRLLVEQGHHFFLTDAEGRTARVIASRGYLVNADQLAAGDTVSVFGFTDRIADPSAPSSDTSARERSALAVRAGDDLPLLVRRLTQAE
jgi:hypothetical protein